MTHDVRTTCPYCGVGCGVIVTAHDGVVTGVRGDPEHPANFGRLCAKGSTLARSMQPHVLRQVRATVPMVRASKDAPLARVDWATAVDHVADRITDAVRTHGPDSVAFYLSGQLLTEDYYVFNKFAKGLIGTNNVDTNSRLCMSSAVSGYKATLGADAPPACYEDIDHADLLFIAGSNAAWTHPVLFRRIEDAKARRPALKIVVVDPRATETAQCADLHLAIRPGTDVALFHAMLHVLLWEGRVAHEWIARHTHGFDALRDTVRDMTPAVASALCGVPEHAIVEAARWWGDARAVLSLYCQGLNQSTSGTAKNAALIGLHLATAQIGRPGAGPFSLTGQPNAMGGREVGGLANLLGGHREVDNASHRAEIAALWGVETVPARAGKTAVELFDAARDGAIKVLWIVCTNPAQSMPHQRHVREALERVDCVIVQEAYATTATVRYADVLLPAASWAEKDGTVTNSERRISRVRVAVDAPGEAREDWRIAVGVAQRVERALRPERASLFDYPTAESIWNEHRETTRGRDLDITGLSYARLDADGPQCWPCPQPDAPARTRLYEDARFATADGRARFVADQVRPAVDVVDARFPFALTTARLRDHWHAMSRTGTVAALFGHAPEPSVDVHPDDIARRGLHDGEWVRVTSRRGSVGLRVRSDPSIAPACAHIAMHWGDEFVGGRVCAGGVNAVTQGAFDPVSKQPELKHAAVRIEPLDAPWPLVAFAWLDPHHALEAQTHLRNALGAFDAAHCVPFGDVDRTGLLVRGAARSALDATVIETIEHALHLHGSGVMRYDDLRLGVHRRVRLHDGALRGVLLAGDPTAESWLRAALEAGTDVTALGLALLAPSRTPPTTIVARGVRVCQCHDVSADEIDACLNAMPAAARHDPQAALGALQAALGCGTSCGACLPEVRRAVRQAAQRVDA